MTEPTARLAGKATLSAMLHALAQDECRDRIAVSDLLAALGDRAVAALLFVFAVPNVLPVPPGTSTILGAPLVFLAAQLAFGRRPWLPAVIARRTMTPLKDPLWGPRRHVIAARPPGAGPCCRWASPRSADALGLASLPKSDAPCPK